MFVRQRSYHVAHNVLDYYAELEPKFPSIVRLARRYLCIPSANVASESLWSLAGSASEDERSCLSGASGDAADDTAQLSGAREHEASARHAIKAFEGLIRPAEQNSAEPRLSLVYPLPNLANLGYSPRAFYNSPSAKRESHHDRQCVQRGGR